MYRPLILIVGIVLSSSSILLRAQENNVAPPWDEPALVKMAELGLDGPTVIRQLKKRSWKFEVNDDLLSRLKGAGMPQEAIEFLRTSALPQTAGVAENLMVWVQRDSAYQEASLHSELWINGARVDAFASDSQAPVRRYFKPGWNDVTLKTTPQPAAERLNELKFSIGPVHEGPDGKPVMRPLYRFFNGTDWTLKAGRHHHKLGPEVQDVTLTFAVYYAPEPADTPLGQGDFVLEANADSDYNNSSVTVTVWVNGQPVNSFSGLDRQAVVTSFLHQGRNEVRIVAKRVNNDATNNEIYVSLSGHALFNRQHQKYEFKRILQLQGLFGWERDQRTLELKSRLDRRSDTIERVIPFYVEEDPQAVKITTDHALDPTLMVWTDRESDYSEASLHSELRINGQLVDVFTSNTRKSIASYVKPGENVVTLKTVFQPGADRKNQLRFHFGQVSRDKDDKIVSMPIWSFDNGTDWTFEDDRLVHLLGKDVQQQEISMRPFFVDTERLGREVGKGDFVLQSSPDSEYKNTTTTVTVYVNGKPLNSFDKQKRQVVITDLLQKGRNDVRVVSRYVEGNVTENGLALWVGGPARFDLTTQEHVLPPILQDIQGLEGWKQNAQSLTWENKTRPGGATVERTFTFSLDEAP